MPIAVWANPTRNQREAHSPAAALTSGLGRVRQASVWGPEHVLHYLARYTHRVAISNHRLLSVADGKVSFRWKDYAHGSKPRKTVTAEEFLRRFMLHVLPSQAARWLALPPLRRRNASHRETHRSTDPQQMC